LTLYLHAQLVANAPIGPGWQPTVENINGLPDPLRRYIHDMETVCDPAGIVARNILLTDQIVMTARVLPEINIRCETTSDGIQGMTTLNVVRVEAEDDGSFTAVTDHWPATSPSLPLTEGARRIAEERRRQIEQEGWTPEHDAAHDSHEIVKAAVSYVIPHEFRGGNPPVYWPWEPAAWKPSPDDRVRELVKAGALIAAEIDRLLLSQQEG
jgi:hypothetical protein